MVDPIIVHLLVKAKIIGEDQVFATQLVEVLEILATTFESVAVTLHVLATNDLLNLA